MGPEGPEGPQGPEGPEGPPGPALENEAVAVETDQAMLGTQLNATFSPTNTPAALSAELEPGRYLLTWYTEFMRVGGGTQRVFARMRDVTANSSVALMRTLSPEGGAVGSIPIDSQPGEVGEVIPFSGSQVFDYAGGFKHFELQYGLSSASGSGISLRVRRQRITLLKIE